ncbi:CX domain-containing protein [Caenorhabditis elegans]|uniref:CX domain-containing protein n=1 Tax=Caenorhabditis elegans TaxID=6239 RepID=Q4EVY2_CAEEL|nr:CX domain-containing protein [Caenorhabditis elegans]CAJ15163.1 CX domain-containing protein [Caenorhabditis elegans]|eukprot:NP_001021243.1 Uncharacterized protein CELE_F02A9.7 [Caenorhabditis elegans]
MIVLILIFTLPTVISQFHLFIVINCDSYCHVTFRDNEMQYYSIMENTAQISRHFDVPVERVEFQIDNFFNSTDFMPVTTNLDWVSHLNKTFYHKGDGFMIIGHYFCPEGSCLVDHTRSEYNQKIDKWCCALVLLGFLFFLLISGIADTIFKWTKKKLNGKKIESQVYKSLELVDMSKKNENAPGVGA